jgi:hypothetical protein
VIEVGGAVEQCIGQRLIAKLQNALESGAPARSA